MFITHTENSRHLRIEIIHDEDAVSPREDDNFGHMVCQHRRYRLGDGLPSRLSDRFHSLSSRHGLSETAFFWRWKNLHKKHLLLLPLYLYDHSGLTISTSPFSCPWDSGHIGWIFVTHQKIRQEYGEEDLTLEILERAKQVLIGEVKIDDHYLRGDAWG